MTLDKFETKAFTSDLLMYNDYTLPSDIDFDAIYT